MCTQLDTTSRGDQESQTPPPPQHTESFLLFFPHEMDSPNWLGVDHQQTKSCVCSADAEMSRNQNLSDPTNVWHFVYGQHCDR